MSDLKTLRQRIGENLSDEEFLLRATMPANLVDAMQAKGPARRANTIREGAGDEPAARGAPRAPT